MAKIVNWDGWFDRLLRRKQEPGQARAATTTDALNKVVIRMERYQEELHIPDKDIAIIGYLARNPMALIIQDANVKHAFLSARRAMNI